MLSLSLNDLQKKPAPWSPPLTQHPGFMLLEFSIKAVSLIVPLRQLGVTRERLAALRTPGSYFNPFAKNVFLRNGKNTQTKQAHLRQLRKKRKTAHLFPPQTSNQFLIYFVLFS